MQLILNFLEVPLPGTILETSLPETNVWEQLNDEQRAKAVENLASLMAKATDTTRKEEKSDD